MDIQVEKLDKEQLFYDNEHPFDTIIYAYTSEDKQSYDFALIYRGYITAFGREEPREGGVTSSYKIDNIYKTLCWTKFRRPEFYNELIKYKIADKNFLINNPELEEQIKHVKLEKERRQNEHRKQILLQGLSIAKFALEREIEKLKKETLCNRSNAVQ